MKNRVYNEPGVRHDIADVIVGALGHEQAFDALVRAMSDDQAKDLFEYIARMHEIEYEVVNG